MKEEELNKIMQEYFYDYNTDCKSPGDNYKDGFKKAFELILSKREEYGHGYLKGKLLDWMLELGIS